MTIFEAVILGLVQGLAEFLPISSSGHLALLQYFFGIEGDSVLSFTVLLHVGTLISVFAVYGRDICELVLELFATIKDICTGKGLRVNANPTRRLGFMIIVATIPTGIIGLCFEDLFSDLYLSLTAIGAGLILTCIILLIAERLNKGDKKVGEMSFKNAFFVGLCQGMALLPGVSRSGSTLFGGLTSGLERKFAVKFAFLVSIPTILGSVILEAPAAFSEGADASLVLALVMGTAVAAISGFVAIKTMIKIVSDKKLVYFSAYTFVVGAAVLVYSLIGC